MCIRCIECFGQVMILKKNFTDTVSEKIAVPQETMSQIPLVQLHGKRSVCIENHCGIMEYTDSLVKIAVKRGNVAVIGSRLEIARMTKRIVEIRGSIQRLELE